MSDALDRVIRSLRKLIDAEEERIVALRGLITEISGDLGEVNFELKARGKEQPAGDSCIEKGIKRSLALAEDMRKWELRLNAISGCVLIDFGELLRPERRDLPYLARGMNLRVRHSPAVTWTVLGFDNWPHAIYPVISGTESRKVHVTDGNGFFQLDDDWIIDNCELANSFTPLAGGTNERALLAGECPQYVGKWMRLQQSLTLPVWEVEALRSDGLYTLLKAVTHPPRDSKDNYFRDSLEVPTPAILGGCGWKLESDYAPWEAGLTAPRR
jgi:hypothetical protein